MSKFEILYIFSLNTPIENRERRQNRQKEKAENKIKLRK